MNTTTINPPETAADIRLQLKKFIRAKRDRVFAAWTQPEMMKRWFAPGPMRVAEATADARVGGAYSVRMVNDTGESGGGAAAGSTCGTDSTVRGRYTKLIPGELIAFTWQFQQDPLPPESLVTVEFRDADGGTEVTLTHTRFATAEMRDRHEHGWAGCLESLATFAQDTLSY